MPYDPYQPEPASRSRAYTVIWLGAAAFLVLCIWTSISPSAEPPGILFGLALGAPFAASVANRADEYQKNLFYFGLRWMGGGAVIYAFIAWIARSTIDNTLYRGWLLDGYLASLALVGCFYIGYAIAWVRDQSFWNKGA